MLKPKDKLKQSSKIILVNIIFIVVFFGVYYFFIKSGLDELSTINQSINSNLSALKTLEKKDSDVRKLKQSLTLADSVVNKLSEYFIKDEVEFVTAMETTAAEIGLTERLVMGEMKVNGKIRVIPITLYTQGSFKQQLEFIDQLGNLKYFFNIRSVNFSKVSSKEPGDIKIDMTLNVDTYWQANEK